MSLVRLVARPMLASAYIGNGISRMKNPQAATGSLQPVANLVKKKLDFNVDAELLARTTGIAQVAAGSMLALGKLPRVSSTILVSTFMLELVGEQLNKETRNRSTLLAKTSMLGGALLASVDTAGKPGLAWRAQHAAENLWHEVEKTSAKALDAVNINA